MQGWRTTLLTLAGVAGVLCAGMLITSPELARAAMEYIAILTGGHAVYRYFQDKGTPPKQG